MKNLCKILLIWFVFFFGGLVPAYSQDVWWQDAWPYRIAVDVSESGIVEVDIDFGTAFTALGLNHGLLDPHSIRVVPFTAGEYGAPLVFREGFSTVLENADNPQIGWHGSGVYWTVNDGFAEPDSTRFSEGTGSVKATVQNLVGGYGYPGVEFRITGGEPLADWSNYEIFTYDVWPEVNATALDQAPDLYWYKLYNACDGSSVTQGGPPMALDQWNHARVSLNPLDHCWDADGRDLADITRMEFHTRDNETVNGNSGLWDDGDELILWFDNLRLVDQDTGFLRWQTTGADKYYVYFDTLTHGSHEPPLTDPSMGSASLTGTVSSPEAGGYYRLAQSGGDVMVWSAPATEKILKTMAVPAVTGTVEIAAARGEFEPFQLIIHAGSATNLPVSISDFTGPGTDITGTVLHRVDYVPITTAGDHFDRFGDWPDPLWPINSGEMVAVAAGENQPVWFTVHVPWGAAPGIYTANVSVGALTIPVELEVWDFTLPRQIHLVSEWGFSWSSIVEDIYQGYGDWPCYWEMLEAFKQDFIDHRLIPKSVAWPAGLNYPGGVEYDCAGGLDPDAWGDWDFATIGGKYIHGEDGFNSGYGFPSFVSHGPRSNWPPDSLPYSFCGIDRVGTLGSPEFQAKWSEYLASVDAYIVSDGYADEAYYHIVNEPQTFDDYAITGQISALTQAAAPNLLQLISEQVEPAIYNFMGADIDIWMPTITNYEPVKSQDRQLNHGEAVWWYYLYGDDPPLPNPILMSHPGLETRITPWLAWAERVDGLLHYTATDWSPNPWLDANVTGQDNGDGFFFYPPRKDGGNLDYCGQNGHRLVPSIRWENLRDGMEDYEYLYLLTGSKPGIGVSGPADDFVAQLVDSRTRYTLIPTELKAVRRAMAEALSCANTGDVTGDGDITAGDAQLAFGIALGTYSPSTTEYCAADCNGDGDVTAGDAQGIFAAALGMGSCVDLL